MCINNYKGSEIWSGQLNREFLTSCDTSSTQRENCIQWCQATQFKLFLKKIKISYW